MAEEMLTLPKFEKGRNQKSNTGDQTGLQQILCCTGNKVYLKPENMQRTGAYSHMTPITKSAIPMKRSAQKD